MQMRRGVPLFFLFVAMAAPLSHSVPEPGQEPSGQPVVKQAAATQFESLPNVPVPDCATAAVENGDPAKGASILLAKFASGCDVPWHWHTANEHVMIVSGALRIQARGEKSVMMWPGDFARMPARHVHHAHCSASAGCTFFLYSDGAFDIHYVDREGKEIPPAEALKAVNPAPEKGKSK